MPQFIEVPMGRLAPEILKALLEEYASRDGTDYGERELTLAEKVASLEGQLSAGELCILFDAESEQWDLVSRENADAMLIE